MTGPLANEFARLESRLAPGWRGNHSDPHEAELDREALARIEEHTNNTEKALREIEALPTPSLQGGRRFFVEAQEIARAALSAVEGTPA